MNVFTTDHPLASDVPGSRSRSGLGTVLVVTLMLCPVFSGVFWFMDLTGNQDTTDYTPDPFWQVFVDAVVDSFIVALVAVGVYYLGSFIFRKVCNGPRPL